MFPVENGFLENGFLVENGFLETISFVALRQNKVKGLLSSQSPRLNQKLIYIMKLQLKINFKT